MKEDIIKHLSSCTGNELIEILTKALSNRPEASTTNGVETKLIVSNASRLIDRDSKHYQGWDFSPIGDLDLEKHNRNTEGEPFLQSGHCIDCDIEIDSHVKAAICPLCGRKVSCT